MLPINRVQIR